MIYFLYHDTPEKKLLETVLGEPTHNCVGGDMWDVRGKESQKKAREWERDCKLQFELDLDYARSGDVGTIKREKCKTVIGRYELY